MKKVFLRGLFLFFVFILVLLNTSCAWFLNVFGEMEFSVVVYQLFSPMKGTSTGIVDQYCDTALVQAVLITICFMLLFYAVDLGIKIFHFHFKSKIAKFYKPAILLIGLSLFVPSLGRKMIEMKIPDYFHELQTASTIYEDYFVEPSDVEITFPEKKRNLILIYMESMETTYASVEDGGGKPVEYIPELVELANENISFSDRQGFGGAYSMYGTDWTMAALLATSTGATYKFPFDGNSSGNYEKYLPGIVSLGDILQQEGYQNYFMCGSDAQFGGRRDFYTQHGNYEILDYGQAVEKGVVPEDYFEFWGIEDEKLYQFARQELEEISKEEAPFNFTMLTVDTHHPDGYHCQLCEETYPTQYENALRCASKQVVDFVEWIQQQPWYENTTIVITGDHISMKADFWDDIGDYRRKTYNCFINCAAENEDENTKERIFCALDLFPTILGSINVKIEGNRLGLGTNLFSSQMTLSEEIGFEQENNELKPYSAYYFNHFIVN